MSTANGAPLKLPKNERISTPFRFKGVYEAPIDKLGPLGRWIRHRLLDAILAGTCVLVAIQRYRTPKRDRYMHLFSFFGTEDFYTPLVVILSWLVDARLGRLFIILMAVGFYLATWNKNFLQLPRPPNPPVDVLERAHDWSLPSLHAVLGVVLPWYLWIYSYVHYHLSFQATFILFFIIAFWSFSVMFSRVYLGVHSPADIVAGGSIGVLLLSAYLRVDDHLDHYIGYGANVSIQMCITVILMLAIHPTSDHPTLSRGDSVVTSAVAFGTILGRTRTSGYHSIYSSLLEQMGDAFTWQRWLAVSGARLLLGLPIIVLARLLTKTVVKSCTIHLCKVFNKPAISLTDYHKRTRPLNKHFTQGFKLPPIFPKEKKETVSDDDTASTKSDSSDDDLAHYVQLPFDVDIPTKFITYTLMSWTACELCPWLFYQLKLI